MQRLPFLALILAVFLSSASPLAAAKGKLRPFVLAEESSGDFDSKVAGVKSSLENQGFTVVGEYAPYADAYIVVVTNDDLRRHAAQSKFGGYGAAQRVAVTKVDDQIQVSYTNPAWMGNIYRMKGEMEDTAAKLKEALGWETEYGSEKGIKASRLRKYHYTILMPYFDDHIEIASHRSHQAAVDAVEAGLAAGKGGTVKIYRVDIDGKDEVLFGAAIQKGEGADSAVMNNCDTSNPRHTAHLPYEMLVSGNKVYVLHGKFRIAQSFPDLTMGTFMQISDAPDGIRDSLKAAANN